MITEIHKINTPEDSLNIKVGADTLIIACGALAKEILQIRDMNNMQNQLDIQCLPAKLHNTPQLIPDLLRQKILLFEKSCFLLLMVFLLLTLWGIVFRLVF